MEGQDQDDNAARRSSRVNFGVPPDRYGDWISQMPEDILSSTQQQVANSAEIRRNTVVGAEGGDDKSGALLTENIDQEIARLEQNISKKLKLMEAFHKLRRESIQIQLGDEQEYKESSDVEDEEEWKPENVEQLSSVQYGDQNRARYFPTPQLPPRQPQPYRISQPLPPQPQVPPVVSQNMAYYQSRPPPTYVNAMGSGATYQPPPQPVYTSQMGGMPPQMQQPTFTSPAGAAGIIPPPPGFGFGAHTGMDALAGAIVSAIQVQNTNTERFVARQSTSSALPVFSGNPLEWPLFAHHFIQSTQDCGFTPQQNMARLEKALRGEARKTVRSLMIIPTNTLAVMSRLEQRFGRPQMVIQALMDIAKKTPSLKEGKLSSVVDFSNAVNNLVTTVQTLQQPSYLENPQLVQELVDKLPDVLKLQWGLRAMNHGGRANLEHFAMWIDQMSSAASMVTMPKVNLKEPKKEDNVFVSSEDSPDSTATVSSSRGAPSSRQRACDACGKNGHDVAACFKFKKMSVQQRWDLAQKKEICYRCLAGKHMSRRCKSDVICKEDGCGRKHHTLLHGQPRKPETDPKEDKKEEGEVKDINATAINKSNSSLLRIICVTLYGPAGNLTVNALLDEASTVTLIAADVANKLGLTGEVDPLRLKWTDGTVQSDIGSRRVDIQVGPVAQKMKFKLKKARTVECLNLPHQRSDLEEIVKLYPHLQKTKFKYLPGERPALLIGQGHIHWTVAREIVENKVHEPMLTRTMLGWILHGPGVGQDKEEATVSCVHEADDDIIHNLVKESFTLENIGIKSNVSIRSKEDVVAEDKIKSITRRLDDRWETGLLWRKEPVSLPNSRGVAERRLNQVQRKLSRNEDLRLQYTDKINHYVKMGYARKLTLEEIAVKSDKEWYLPHFDTQHPNKPGKIRIVFDAASRSCGVSLNDYLLTGPDLLISLPGVLLRFRQRRIAVSGDIAEMFHQVRIRDEDCPSQRFLWREGNDEQPSVFQLQVMMFGSVCSPYCAQYIKNTNAIEHEEEFPAAAHAIINNHYMDDWLHSVDSVGEGVQLATEVVEVHKRGGFQIGKWTSNSSELLNVLKADKDVEVTKNLAEWSEVPTERALGLHWIPQEDVFTYRVNLTRAGEGIATGDVIPTKRAVLRLVMLVWDPLGFLSHYLIKARILLQDLWRKKIGWDDQITCKQYKKWKLWTEDLPKLAKARIPRCFSKMASTGKDVRLHIFADSSEAASCAVAYLRVAEGDGQVSVSIVMAKARVAPVKPCSVPRLELTAALIACRLGKFIQMELDIEIHGLTYWTDSMTTLRWIRSEARQFQQFVAIRVGEIQESSEVGQWRWVPSALNPADEGTREGRANLDKDSRWWNGPPFLKLNPDEFPIEKGDIQLEHLELRKEFLAVTICLPELIIPEVSRFSNFLRLVRCTAWMLRLMDKLRKRETTFNHLISKAEILLFKRSQWESYPQDMQLLKEGKELHRSSHLLELSPMLDADGVLRMKSRLSTASEERIRQPVILHPKNELTFLLVVHYHKMHNHAGEDLVKNEIRQRFWIPHISSVVRNVVRGCVLCRRRRIKGQAPMMGALPNFKIQPQPRPFFICGMDYFGPMEVTIGRRHEKRYGVLFTCMNTRAVHLEVAHNLTTDSCIMAIRRLVSKRGQPSQMWSDNGTNLRGAEKELRLALEELDQEKITADLEVKGTEWHFIPPAAPHMGGSWERLVRSVKTAMSVTMKSRAPREEVLLTVFAEAEATVNSRPLTDVPVDPESMEALTPFHFLIGTSSTMVPPGTFDKSEVDLRVQWRKSQALADIFWKRWVREYIPTLQRRAKWHMSKPSVEVGDIVVVLDESLKRNTWPIGLITQIFPGKDGVVRVAEVKTSTGVYRRPVVKLGKLDVKADT